MPTLPESFITRMATLDDAEAAVELANACSIELTGNPQFDLNQFRTDWTSPTLNPQTDLHLVFTPDKELVGYAGVWDVEPHVQPFAWGDVHPAYRGQGIGTYLARWVEARARRSIPRAPGGARVVLLQSRPNIDAAGRELLQQQGFRATRYTFRMRIKMETLPAGPVLPEGLVIRTFVREQQLRPMILAMREIFKDHWGHVERPLEEVVKEWEHRIDNDPDHDPSFWFLALDGEEIAGVSLCWLRSAEGPQVSHLRTLGVRRAWRRRGLGLALLRHSFRELYRRGQRAVVLSVDAQNLTGAIRLYEKAGMHVQHQNVTYEKELRPGEELRTETVEE